jgi:hypothetical protein
MPIKLTTINPTGGYIQPTLITDVVDTLGKIELTGVAGVALTTNGADITGLPATPSGATAAASKAYVDSIAVSGATWVNPVVVVATSSVTLSGSQTIDSVTPANGARVLVTGQNGTTPDAANGIYIVNTGGAWSRSSDTLADGTAMFVEQGTTYAGTQWVLTTNNPITAGVTAIIFTQFGGGTTYTNGDGLNLVGTTFSVKGDGTKAINVDASAGVQVVVDTNYGLSIDSSAGIRVDLDATPGLEFNSGNLRIKIASADQLALDASGLNVVGVPSQFEINGSAVSTNVTATNLNALTDSSSVTALHRHAQLFAQGQAGAGIAAGNPVYVTALGSIGNAAANNTATAGVVGVAVTNVNLGDPIVYQTHGACAAFSGLTVGAPYYLDDAGGVDLYTGITSGNRVIRLGYALTNSIIMLNVQDMGVKP